VNGATLPGPGTGYPSAPLQGVLPAAAPAGRHEPLGVPSDNTQAADFASILCLVSTAAFEPAGLAAIPAVAAPPTAEGAKLMAAAQRWEAPPLVGMPVPRGTFSPPTGNALPPGLPPATAAPSETGRAATIVAPAEASVDASRLAPKGLPVALSPFVVTITAAAVPPARWTQSLPVGERGTAGGELPVAESHDGVSVAEALFAPTSGTRGAQPTATLALPVYPAQQPAFERALGERLAWLVQEGPHDARIKLHPAELGSIDIRLSLDGDSTRISLASPHAVVRDALEQAVPRLRELLGSAGLDLSHVDVGTGDGRSHADFSRPTLPQPGGRERLARAEDVVASAGALALLLPQRLVDTFA
jgi:hypothetical protein